MNRKWTNEELDYVRQNAGVQTDKQIAEYFTQKRGVQTNLQTVRKQRQKLGLRKVPGRGFCKLHELSQEQTVVNP